MWVSDESSHSPDLWDTLRQCVRLGRLARPPNVKFHNVVSMVDQVVAGVTSALYLNCLSYPDQYSPWHSVYRHRLLVPDNLVNLALSQEHYEQ